MSKPMSPIAKTAIAGGIIGGIAAAIYFIFGKSDAKEDETSPAPGGEGGGTTTTPGGGEGGGGTTTTPGGGGWGSTSNWRPWANAAGGESGDRVWVQNVSEPMQMGMIDASRVLASAEWPRSSSGDLEIVGGNVALPAGKTLEGMTNYIRAAKKGGNDVDVLNRPYRVMVRLGAGEAFSENLVVDLTDALYGLPPYNEIGGAGYDYMPLWIFVDYDGPVAGPPGYIEANAGDRRVFIVKLPFVADDEELGKRIMAFVKFDDAAQLTQPFGASQPSSPSWWPF